MRRDFAAHLTHLIREYVLARSGLRLSEDVRAHVTYVRYGSLIFGLGIYGLDQIARALDQNFDVFVGVTEGLIYRAFDSEFGLRAGGAEFDIRATPEARATWISGRRVVDGSAQLDGVESVAAPEEAIALKDKISRVEYFSRLVQGSLFVPVILALIVCYVWMNAWDHERDRAKADADRLSTERTALLEFAKSQLSALSQQNTELNKLLAQTGASEVLAIMHDNTALMQASIAGCCGCSSCCKSRMNTPHKATPAASLSCKK